jgi:O-antigen/teichoic acid export membrane protein
VLVIAWTLSRRDAVAISRYYIIGLAALLGWFTLRIHRSFPGDMTFSGEHARRLLTFGLPALAATLPDAANARLDQVFVAASWGAKPLGLYAVAMTWSSAYSTVFASLIHAIVPHVARVGGIEQQRAEFLRLWRAGVVLAAAMAVITAVAAPFAIPLIFGRQFSSAIPIALVLCFPSMLLALRQLLAAGGLSLGRPKPLAQASILALVLNLGLLWVLTPLSFTFGPSIAATIAHAVSSFLLLSRLRVDLGAAPRDLLPSVVDVLTVMTVLRRWAHGALRAFAASWG